MPEVKISGKSCHCTIRVPRLLVEIVEKFIATGHQRPDIDHAFTAGRDDLFYAQRNALEFHWRSIEILGMAEATTSVYVLNMGQPIKIVDLAERMIRLSGLEPGRDVDIVFTGIRPGERLNEILFAREEPTSDIGIEGVVAAAPVCPSVDVVEGWLAELKRDLEAGERAAIYGVLRQAVPNFAGVLEPVQ